MIKKNKEKKCQSSPLSLQQPVYFMHAPAHKYNYFIVWPVIVYMDIDMFMFVHDDTIACCFATCRCPSTLDCGARRRKKISNIGVCASNLPKRMSIFGRAVVHAFGCVAPCAHAINIMRTLLRHSTSHSLLMRGNVCSTVGSTFFFLAVEGKDLMLCLFALALVLLTTVSVLNHDYPKTVG